tara:strand:- start:1316 stop:1876 length:561 start_codon:yes stop_codon:yes gene_type:complete
MIKIIFFFFIILNLQIAKASPNIEIAKNFKKINSLKFNFVQKIDNNNIEKGECIILYPKKIFCSYEDIYNKILVSNGKSLIINSDKIKNYYRYPLDKTPLNLILDKKFVISKIYDLKEDLAYPFFYVFDVDYENVSIKVFFDKNNLDIIGWETRDIYQNIIQTFISDIQKNIKVDSKIFAIQRYIN